MKLEVGEKMKKGKEKKKEDYIKKGGKGLKNASFWAIKNFAVVSSDPAPLPSAANLFVRGKNLISKEDLLLLYIVFGYFF